MCRRYASALSNVQQWPRRCAEPSLHDQPYNAFGDAGAGMDSRRVRHDRCYSLRAFGMASPGMNFASGLTGHNQSRIKLRLKWMLCAMTLLMIGAVMRLRRW